MNWRGFLLMAFLAGAAAAQLAQPDSLKPAKPDSLKTTTPDTARYRPAKSPGTAVLLSLLVPGGGQVYTGNWWKACLIAPAEVTLGYFTVNEHLAANDANARGDSAAYVLHRDRRTAFLWWTGAVTAFSMADAWVSAQMYGFDREMKLAGPDRRVAITFGPTRLGLTARF